MDRLKAETAEAHRAAESHPLQQAIIRAQLPREQYARHLAQMLHVHRALYRALTRSAPKEPRIAPILRPFHDREPELRDDIEFFAPEAADDSALPATSALLSFIERASSTSPLALLGLHYVLEGSTNGGRFIAKALRRGYQLTDGRGTRSMDPYGDEQPARWAQFKADMNAQSFTDAERDAIIGGARAMFRAISDIGDDGLRAHPLPSTALPIIPAPSGAG